MQTLLETWDDLTWLRDVHKIRLVNPEKPFPVAVSAVIYGNEDAPDKVEVYWKDHYRNDFSVYEADEAGHLKLIHQGSHRLRPRTKQESEAGCL